MECIIEKEVCSLVTSSTNRETRQFRVLVVHRRQRNVPKSVLHVQSCCFASLNLLLLQFSLLSRPSLLLHKLPSDMFVLQVCFFL